MKLELERVGLEKKFFDLCSKIVPEVGFILYDLEYLASNTLLRVYIMNKETKTALIDDCVLVDAALTPYIDSLEWMPPSLTLEVSSPGIYRKLQSLDHFQNVVGEQIELTIMGKIEIPALKGQKKFKAQLVQASEQSVELLYNETKIEIAFEYIKKANLSPDL